MGKIVGLDIGESSVKMAYFSGRELKKAVSADLPDAMVSGGRILSMDAMADFLKESGWIITTIFRRERFKRPCLSASLIWRMN